MSDSSQTPPTNTLYSKRFNRAVQITAHARRRMAERGISETELLEIVETGALKHKDARRLWIYKDFPNRSDNMLCVAVLLDGVLIVKTVMHRFQPWS